jgi:hypothetical protein
VWCDRHLAAGYNGSKLEKSSSWSDFAPTRWPAAGVREGRARKVRGGWRLLYTFDEHEEYKIAATLTPAGERELAELLALATRDREFPCPGECGFLGCPGTWILHNTDAAGGFEVSFCDIQHMEHTAEFEDALNVLLSPLECVSNEFVEVETPCTL